MIIITTQCFAPQIGGIESLMTGMAEALSYSGKEITVLADGKTEQNTKIKYIIKRFNAWKPIRRRQKAKYVKKLCKTNNVECIIADSWKSVEYLSNLNTKIIVLAHGTEIPKQYWNYMLGHLRFKKNRIISSYGNADKIIANSNYTKELMHVSLKIDYNKISVIHPGIDIYDGFISKSDEQRIENLIKDRSPILTTLARVEERKGHSYVLNAVAELKKEFPDILYLIAGQGPYLSKVKSQVKELGIEREIFFLGWITEPEKSVVLKNSDVFIMTPKIVGESVEGFGMAFIDAAFHGLPSIGTKSGGIEDAIIHLKTGILCNPEDQKNITSNIKKILSDNELRETIGINGKKRAENLFTWKNKVKEYLKIIHLK